MNKPTATTVETMYGVERTYTATRLSSSNRCPDYAVEVDGVRVAVISRLGGRRFLIADADGKNGWEFIAPDHGKVADVMDYAARLWVHGTRAGA